MANGLKPIGESIKSIIEKIKKEREERRRRKNNKPIRTQPKLPGMKKGGSAKKSKAMVISIGIGKAKDYPGMKEIMKKNKKGKKNSLRVELHLVARKESLAQVQQLKELDSKEYFRRENGQFKNKYAQKNGNGPKTYWHEKRWYETRL